VLEPVPDYLANLSGSLRGTRIGVDPRWTSEGVDAVTKKIFQGALRVAADLGAEVQDIVFPDPSAVIADWFPLCGVETAVAHEATYPSRKSEYGPSLASLIELGLKQSGTDYEKIVLRRETFRGLVRALFEKVDLLAVPAQTFAAPTLSKMATLGENPELITGLLRFSCPFDMTGSPSITLPGGFTETGGPVAFQFIGRHFDEARLIAAGDAYQRVTEWHRRHPSLGN
jgi:amidase